MIKSAYLKRAFETMKTKHPYEEEFHQAVFEMLDAIDHIINEHPEYQKNNVVERLLEPDRTISFRVTWMNQKGGVEVNRAYRVQYNNAIGIYKGGIRFHPSVNVSILKFLAFEQTFKNALTPFLMGGAKGGSDFDPKGRSDEDIMRFCQAFMSELSRHIGDELDVPAGDLGVGRREIGFMYGFYKKLQNKTTSAFTSKDPLYGGSLGRTEATGYGLVYFAEEALKTMLKSGFKDKRVVISGSGNVATHAARKAIELGAKVVAMSDTTGYIYNPHGLNIDSISNIKLVKRLSLEEYTKLFENSKFNPNSADIWNIKCDIALPCATQNELDEKGIRALIDNGVQLVGEGANMPVTKEGIDMLKRNKVIFAPGKAANAGGVLVSALEISQNHQFFSYSFEKVDQILKESMQKIFKDVYDTALKYNKKNDLLFGANVYSFKRVADAMIGQGVI